MARRTLVLIFLLWAAPAHAGIHFSAEKYAALPAQWRGFLLDQRALRNIAVEPAGQAPSAWRIKYREEVQKLEGRRRDDALSADELADLGALHLRQGEPAAALDVLRAAARLHPNHFAIAANLAMAYQASGSLVQAIEAQEQAVRLAPGVWLPYEQAHLKLLRGRLRGPAGELDDLFGVRFVNELGVYEPGKLSGAERKRLPAKSIAIAQQLALWLPADGPLLWQCAELAAAHGDLASAAAMMEGCVAQFGMQSPTLRAHRQQVRLALDQLAPMAGAHEHSAAFRTRRPLLSKLDLLPLPPVNAKGTNEIPWELFAETAIERPFRPRFADYLVELEGKTVSLTGFMVPVGEEAEGPAFLFVESPIGCWYCESPDFTAMLHVSLPAGTSTRVQRNQVRVTGQLSLNREDPEDYLYHLRDARVAGIE